MSRILLAAALLGAVGCGSLDVASRGAMPSDLLEPIGSHPEEPLLLGCDDLGNLSLNGQPLDVPVSREPTADELAWLRKLDPKGIAAREVKS